MTALEIVRLVAKVETHRAELSQENIKASLTGLERFTKLFRGPIETLSELAEELQSETCEFSRSIVGLYQILNTQTESLNSSDSLSVTEPQAA